MRSARRKLSSASSGSSSLPKNGPLVRDLYPPRPSRLFSSQDSCGENDSSSSSPSDYLDSDTDYSDPETEMEPESEIHTVEDVEEMLQEGISGGELDSEGEEIMKNIAECKAEGRAKPKHKPQTIKLWKREGEHWTT
jgi:hypothetical protein